LSQAQELLARDTPEVASPARLHVLLHALSQPLTALSCALALGVASERAPEDYRRLLRQAIRQTEQLNQIARDLASYAEDLHMAGSLVDDDSGDAYSKLSLEENGCVTCTAAE